MKYKNFRNPTRKDSKLKNPSKSSNHWIAYSSHFLFSTLQHDKHMNPQKRHIMIKKTNPTNLNLFKNIVRYQ
ncbi:hypothetical protein C826_00056 [Helicobacter bilis WiWa]|uniref:Uncharacterized protein n=1 Tax=Helicobacter bilis WiWa TaxID=1235804 RepID=N2BLG4_9HELI|nr:hypothetical protein C826_00056 [Helicobacter bilis WiWa]